MTSLDGRLQAAAKFVTENGFVADIGTDHGYLPISLVIEGRSRGALATDINEKPLEAARENISQAALSEKIGVQLCDGLRGVALSGITDIVIAGMGGMLIAEILKARQGELDGKNLILQPMTQAPYLRRWLLENGFALLAECPAEAAGKYYTVLNARFDGEKRECSDYFSHVGRIPETLSDPVLREPARKYLEALEKKLRVILHGVSRSRRDEEIVHRYEALSKEIGAALADAGLKNGKKDA